MKLIFNMYQDTKAYIKLNNNNKLSNSFICNIGVRLEGAFSLMEALFYNNTSLVLSIIRLCGDSPG